jgi:DNA-directed RNA polymerase specialized sigma24 family protein
MDVAPESTASRNLFWMSSEQRDKKGREANPAVIQAAQIVFPAALLYCEQKAGDSTLAQELLERATYSVSGFIQRYGVKAITSSLEKVVLTAFNQLLEGYLKRQNRHLPLAELENWQEKLAVDSCQEVFYFLQMEELLEEVPQEVAVIFRLLYEEYSAEEIGYIIGSPAQNIRSQVCYWRRKFKVRDTVKPSRWKNWRKLGRM